MDFTSDIRETGSFGQFDELVESRQVIHHLKLPLSLSVNFRTANLTSINYISLKREFNGE